MSGIEDSPAGRKRESRSTTPALKPDAGKQPYQAFELSGETQRCLEIRLKDPEPAECPSNARLSNIRADWRGGQFITLEYGITREGMQMMICIQGENLTELHQALKQWRVEWIAEFDVENHLPPSDEAAPFIRSISLHTTRPETPPPENKRH